MRQMLLLLPLLAAVAFFAGREMGGSNLPGTAAAGLPANDGTPVELEASAAAKPARTLAEIESALGNAVLEKDWQRRRMAVYRLVHDAPDDQFPSLLQRVGHNDGYLEAEVLALWWEQSPDAARAWFESQPPKSRYSLVPSAVEAAANRDAPAALRWLASLPDKEAFLQGQLARNNAIQKFAAAAPRETWQLLTGMATIAKQAPFADVVFGEWARSEPLAAAAEVAKLEATSDVKSAFTAAIARNWAVNDPEAARRWVEGLTDWKSRNLAVIAVGAEWAKRDPQAGLTLLSGSLADSASEWQYSRIVGEWVVREPEAAMKYAGELSGKAATVARAAVVTALIPANLDGAIGYWRQNSTDSNLAADLAVALAARDGLPAAAQFLHGASDKAQRAYYDAQERLSQIFGWENLAIAMETLPQGTVRNQAIPSISSVLASAGQLSRAESLVASLPAGEVRMGAMTQIASAIRSQSGPDAAAQWIVERGGTSEGLEQFARSWLFSDRPRALRWIQTSARLPESSRRALLERKSPSAR